MNTRTKNTIGWGLLLTSVVWSGLALWSFLSSDIVLGTIYTTFSMSFGYAGDIVLETTTTKELPVIKDDFLLAAEKEVDDLVADYTS